MFRPQWLSSLLGLLRNEALLLSTVGSDMEFIKEEMESMQSFLEHLARTARPTGGHDEQVRTWMKQVRDLARDCSNFIELHHRRGDLAVYRARGRGWRYLWWAGWLVHKMVAQHSVASRLRELKERARDVGKRRLRYGVEIPRNNVVAAVPGAGGTSDAASSMLPLPWPYPATAAPADAEEEDDDEQDDKAAEVAATDSSNPHRRALEEPRVLLEDYCAEKLARWLELQSKAKEVAIASTAIVAPDDAENAGAIARESLNLATSSHFTCKVWINLPDLHLPWDLPLLPSEVLAYILHDLERQKQEQDERKQQQQQGQEVVQDHKDPQWQAFRYKRDLDNKIWNMISYQDINDKIENIRNKIGGVDSNIFEGSSKKNMIDKRLGVLLHVLRLLQEAPDTDLPLSWDDAMDETASKLKTHMEQEVEAKPTSDTEQEVNDKPTSNTKQEVKAKPQISLHVNQYKDILKVFLAETQSNTPAPQPQANEASTSATATTLGEDHIKEIIHNHRITLDIIWELLPKQQQQEEEEEEEEGQEGGRDQVTNSTATAAEAVIKQTREEMKDISVEAAKASGAAIAINETKIKLSDINWGITDQLRNKGVVDKINKHLKDKKTLIILQDDEDFLSHCWEETRYALNLLSCAAGSAVIVSTKSCQNAKGFCSPPGEPVTCSLVGLYYDIVLQLTEQRVNNGNDRYNRQILRDILENCHHEFCMKIFAHALYANPNRSYQELCKLNQDLVPQNTLGNKAKKIIKFSYKELPREYKTCLLYLSIFPQGHNIRRSTLIGRWVTEGLITKQDWRTTVRYAERCFEALIKRGLVLPCDIGTAGKVKSCIVDDQVHGFISKIANKEHILDARLSDQWARHFSIFSGLRLRASDKIEKFVQRLPKYSPQLPFLKVLNLEGVNCFEKNQYLKDICNKILLLKYLSLRRTNVTKLPIEINNLHELEVLDIRETRVPENATRNVLLLKLRRLLADHVDSTSGMCAKSCSAVQIPNQIDRMENLEVLSNVKASGDGNDLKEIRNLWQLRKLGVVIQDNYNHLRRLFRAISDLHECLLSLSVTVSPITKNKKVPSSEKKLLQENMVNWQEKTRKLESLTINGVTQTENVQLLVSLAKGCDDLAKVTLSSTLLEQESLMVLAMLPKLRSIRLQSTAYSEMKLIFNKDEFPQLKYFLVEGPDMTDEKTSMTGTDIKFEDGATTELEKIVLSFTNIRSLCGIDNLPKLKELELEANQFLLSFSHKEAAPKQHTENRDDKQNTQNGDTEKNRESRAPGHNTQDQQSTESRAAAEQGTQIRAPEQSTESRAATEQYAQSRAPEQSTESGAAAEQGTQSRTPEQSTKSGAAAEQGTQSRAPEQSTKSGAAAEQDTESRAPEQSTESKAAADQDVEKSTRSKDVNQNTNTRAAEQNTVPKQNTESRFTFKKDKFQHLVCFRFKDSKMTNISFEPEATPELKKIALSLDDTNSKLTGISGLPKLREVELKGDKFLLKFFDQTYQISKMTLKDTQLKQEDIHKLGKKANLRCLVLSDKSYDEIQLTFNKDEFPKLDLLIVECRKIESISFTIESAAPKLERIVWSFNKMKSLSGIRNLPKLKEIECSGEHVPYQVRKDITAHKGKPVLTHKRLPQQLQEKETSTGLGEEGDDTGSPLISRFLKIKSRG